MRLLIAACLLGLATAQAPTPQLVTFANDDSLPSIVTIIATTAGARAPTTTPPTEEAPSPGAEVAKSFAATVASATSSDPLSVLLNNYINPVVTFGPQARLVPTPSSTDTASTAATNVVTNTTATLAQQPQAYKLLALTDSLHSWLGDPANEGSIQSAIATNSTMMDIEVAQADNATAVCGKLSRWSDAVVTPPTREYCCTDDEDLPAGSLATVCNARIHLDVAAFMLSANTTAIASSLGGGATTSRAIANPSSLGAAGRKLKDGGAGGDSGLSDIPCSASDLGNLQKGILPKVSCCFTVAPALDLCLKVSGQIDVVQYTPGSNALVVNRGFEQTTYCSPTHNQGGFLVGAPCTSTPFTSAVFTDIVSNGAVEVDASLCITGGVVIEFLADNLGFDSKELCFAQLDIKFFEVMETLAMFLDVGVDIGSIFDFDLVAEGEVQLGANPPVCNFITSNYDPSIFPWCNDLQTHGCWWNPGDSNLMFTIRLQAVGLISKAWSWPIFRKSSLRSPPCLPSVPLQGITAAPLPPPPRITNVGITFCVKSDGKDGDTYGDVDFRLGDGTHVATISVPKSEWKAGTKHNLNQAVNLQLTPAQVAGASTSMRIQLDWHSNGRDDMLFNAAAQVTFSDTLAPTVNCVDTQHIGCGDHCSFGCPQNVCGWVQQFQLVSGTQTTVCPNCAY